MYARPPRIKDIQPVYVPLAYTPYCRQTSAEKRLCIYWPSKIASSPNQIAQLTFPESAPRPLAKQATTGEENQKKKLYAAELSAADKRERRGSGVQLCRGGLSYLGVIIIG